MNERIREKRKEKNLTLVQLAELVGVRDATIQRYESGAIKTIKHDMIKKLASVLDCSPMYLIGWDDFIMCDDEIMQRKKVPMYTQIACGEPIYADPVPKAYVSVCGDADVDFCVMAKGDSMINAGIKDGDIVFIHSQPTIENGEIAAVQIDDDATLKRVYIAEDTISLCAENPKYAPLVYSKKDFKEIRILGKAVLLQTKIK